jgi:hydrogenase nickel incorporation protein HypB
MCTTCGCGSDQVAIDGAALAPHQHDGHHPHHHHGPDHAHDHHHEHPHDHPHAHHSHAPGTSASRMVQVEQDILAANDGFAARNRKRFGELGVFALNLVSSPGSGKTTLLCRTIEALKQELGVSVIEGDQQTTNDAERIRATGAPAVQVNTGKGCHLDAHMVGHALEHLPLYAGQLLMIENVGNLVCPAEFDLGEAHKVVILSVTEGEDKPLKYPHMFRASDVMLLNKIDLLPYLQFDVAAAIANARRVNPDIRVLQVSATSGAGMEPWLAFLREGAAHAAARRADEIHELGHQLGQLQAQLGARIPR